jgi:exopolyphosphatase/guanosine-5'-triphosphate,3'-diphosphate pyrophosphatase
LEIVDRLCSDDEIEQADRWGLAMRLGQRLSGGVAEALAASRLAIEGDALVLHLAKADAALFGESVDRRLKALAAALGRRPSAAVAD